MSSSNLRDLAGCGLANTSSPPLPPINNRPFVPVLIIVEGVHDVEFLRRLTARLHLEDPSIPYLGLWEQLGLVIFVPFGGGRVLAWSDRFAALGCAECHLYDREIEPETAIRREAVALVNRRPDCRALLLQKLSLENYLHTEALFEAGGGHIPVDDHERMGTVVARHWYLRRPQVREWDALSPRSRRRMANQAKHWLNTDAVDRMTLAMLVERDPDGELLSWLRAIATAVDED